MDLLGLIKKKVGNGENTMFWEEPWKDDVPLKSLFPRIYAFESVKSITVATKTSQPGLASSLRRMPRGGIKQHQMAGLCLKMEDIILPNMIDRWFWSLSGSGEFAVASVCNFIDDHTLADSVPKTRWIKVVPKKINIHAWRVKMDNLPTPFNLSRRGMDLDTIYCPICHMAAETTSHIFFNCPMAKDNYKKITSWWDVNMMAASSCEEWCTWFMSLHLQAKFKTYLEGLDNSSFFATKLGIKMLPSVILFRNGIAGDRVVGFEDLGGKDDFSTRKLEVYLIKKELLLNRLYLKIAIIMEYLVKVSKKARILELKRRNMKITDSDIQYVVSIKEDMVYPCLKLTKDHKGNKINMMYPEEGYTPYLRYRR
ncbi:RNA-directed DNA polymerase, eukaryota, reverse transcriptase zinc-binding domain protein [Tanacetum coccineum]